MIVASLLYTGGPNLVNKVFLPPQCPQYVKSAENLRLCTATQGRVNVEGLISMHVRTGGFRKPVCFGVAENLAVDVLLGTSLNDRCTYGIFPTVRKVVPICSRPVAVINSLPKVSFLFSDITDFEDAYADNDVQAQQGLPCRVKCAVTVPPSTQVTLSAKLNAAGLLKIEPCDDVVERHQTMVARGTMVFMPGRPFNIFVVSLSGNPVHIPKRMAVAYTAALPEFIVHPRGDEPDTMEHSEESGAFILHTCSTTPNSVTKHLTRMVKQKKVSTQCTIRPQIIERPKSTDRSMWKPPPTKKAGFGEIPYKYLLIIPLVAQTFWK